ncbi:MAG TPA: hypothetical protein VEX13_01875 [Chloroflexia bacterium]|nr:hypothetical protein [Chloroflexia bacterium]
MAYRPEFCISAYPGYGLRHAQFTPYEPGITAPGESRLSPYHSEVGPATPRRGLRVLVVCGTLLLAGYVALLLLMQSATLAENPTLIPGRFPLVFDWLRGLFPPDWLAADRGSPLGQLNVRLYLLIIAWLFLVYIVALRLLFRPGGFVAAQGSKALRWILLFTAAMLFVLLFVAGNFSDDVFSYIWYGRIPALQGGNPYINTPIQYAGTDATGWLQYVFFTDLVSVYGPVWQWLAMGIAGLAHAVAGNDIFYHLLGHRLLADIAHLVNVALLWKVAGMVIARYWRRPAVREEVHSTGGTAGVPVRASQADWRVGAQIAATVTLAWNPLVLIEFGLSAHNDGLLLTGLLAAIWLHLAGKWRLAALALALISLVKITALLFFPAYVALLFWQGWGQGVKGERRGIRNMARDASRGVWRAAQAGAILVASWVVAYIPFWADGQALRAILVNPAANYYLHSVGQIIRYRLPEGLSSMAAERGWQPPDAWTVDVIGTSIDGLTRWSLLGITGLVVLAMMWRARTFPHLLSGWGWSVFAYLTIGSAWAWPWYVSWLLVPMALKGPGRLFNAGILLCLTSMTLYSMFPFMAPPYEYLPGWTGAIIMGPPLLYVAVSGLIALWRKLLDRRGG